MRCTIPFRRKPAGGRRSHRRAASPPLMKALIVFCVRLRAALGQRPARALALALLVTLCAAPAGAAEVLLLLSARVGAYAEAGAAFEAELAHASPGTQVTLAEVADSPDLTRYRAVAAIGSAASQYLATLESGPPAVHALIPSASYRALPAALQRTGSAVFIDQPVERQIALLRAALPDWRRLALLYGDATRSLAIELTRAAQKRGMTVASSAVADRAELYSAVQSVLSEPAILLALPDPEVFNSYTVQNILLSAYREKSPVVGFSPAYVRAGALLALHSPAAGVGHQAAQMLAVALAGGALPAPQYPRSFEVSVNARVARSLNISVAGTETLHALLMAQEAAP